ncbi:MAG: hypothetical protein ACLFS4_08715 [Opitutales bacterium]
MNSPAPENRLRKTETQTFFHEPSILAGATLVIPESRESLFFRIADNGTEAKVVDGELWLKSSSRILGYLNAEDSALEADGWYRPGHQVNQRSVMPMMAFALIRAVGASAK